LIHIDKAIGNNTMQFLQAEDFIAKHYLGTGQKDKEMRHKIHFQSMK